MPFPAYEDMDDPLLCFIFLNGGAEYEVRPSATYEPLADFFKLTERERSMARSDGYSGQAWPIHVQWTRQRLINHGYIVSSGNPKWRRGAWRLTPSGIDRARRAAGNYSSLKR